jgi:hypothetical protein
MKIISRLAISGEFIQQTGTRDRRSRSIADQGTSPVTRLPTVSPMEAFQAKFSAAKGRILFSW